MIKALAIKELRETAWIAAVGLAAYACVVATIISPRIEDGMTMLPGMKTLAKAMYSEHDRLFPFVMGSFDSSFTVISLALAAALAFRQTLGEERGGTYGFLLHRPVKRRSALLVKMAVGAGLLLLVSALPILALATWAATPGTHPSPFEWSMTEAVWRIWIVMPIAYLAAFLCGIRRARWFGTRLLPLPAVVAPMMLACLFPYWLPVCLLTLVLTLAVLVASSLWVSTTQDFA